MLNFIDDLILIANKYHLSGKEAEAKKVVEIIYKEMDNCHNINNNSEYYKNRYFVKNAHIYLKKFLESLTI